MTEMDEAVDEMGRVLEEIEEKIRSAFSSMEGEGQDPPQELNFLQTAFSDKWQDVTFGVLGIGITIFGALVALIVRARLRGRLTKYFRRLDAIRDDSRSDPVGAVHELGRFRQGNRAALARGRLTDGQFAAIDLQARDVLAAIRRRILGPVAGLVGGRFEAALDLAIEDGHVSPHERATLQEEMRKARNVAAGDRQRILALLDRIG